MLVFLLGAGAPSHCAGSSENFVLEAEGGESLTAEATEARPTAVFAAGSLGDGAALLAFDARTHAERWRFTRDDPTRADRFEALGAAAGRVCAAGTSEDLAAEETSLLVACVHAVTGEPLWQKELPLPGISFREVSLDLSGRTLAVTVPIFRDFLGLPLILDVLALSFDPRDGGAGDTPEAFLLEPGDGAGYGPLAAAAEVAGSTAFVASSLSGPDPGPEQAALLAFDGRTRSERWRFRRDDPAVSSRFLAVDSSHGRVCAAGWIETDASVPNPLHEVLVACFRRHSGELLWQRRLAFGSNVLLVSVDLAGRTLAVRMLPRPVRFSVPHPPLTLSFDARDGTGGAEPPLLEAEGEADFRSQALEARPSSVFVPGDLSGPGDARRDAALVTFDARTLAERWRYRGDHPQLLGLFTRVDADAGRVCAAGTLETDDESTSHLLVACFREHTGALLWERELAGPGDGVAVPDLDLSGRTLVVRLVVLESSPIPFPPPIPPIPRFVSATQVLAFDAHDGSGAKADPFPWPGPPGGLAVAGE